MKGKISFFIGVLIILSSFFFPSQQGTLVKLGIGFLSAGVIGFIEFLIDNRKRFGILKARIFRRSVPVRVTVAYLFRIEINGKYLLIKRHKKDDNVGYQPVGGAYKYYKEECREVFDQIGVEPCSLVPRDDKTNNDLRIKLKKRKNLHSFIKWFESRKNREIDPRREFKEELLDSGIFPAELFEDIKYVFLNSHLEGIEKAKVFPIDEFRYADIFDLKIDSKEQEQAILEFEAKSDEVIFVTPEEIEKGASNTGIKILPHTFKILPK